MAKTSFDPEALTLLREIRDLLQIIGESREACVDDLLAADAFRTKLLPRADRVIHGAPLWYGWAIVDAFRSGAAYARRMRGDQKTSQAIASGDEGGK